MVLLLLVVNRDRQLVVVIPIIIVREKRVTDSTDSRGRIREAVVKTVIVGSVHAKQRAKRGSAVHTSIGSNIVLVLLLLVEGNR